MEPLRSPRRWQAAFALGMALGLDLGLSQSAFAQRTPGYPDRVQAYDPREVAMLPKYCIYTQDFRAHVAGGNVQSEIDHWYGVMGPTFHAMHHYCWGLMKTTRATILTRDQQSRVFYLRDAITEFDFVLERAPEDFILLPEILTRKGENLIRLGQAPPGIEALQRAAELKPDYWAPYAQLSDYYKDAGDLKKAREVLETGLARAPEAKALKRRLGELEEEIGKRNAAPKSNSKPKASAAP